MQTLEQILLKKVREKTLASVYLINYDSEKTDPEVWVNSFLKGLTPIADHPDVLKVKKGEKENDYKVDSPGILQFLKFINYRPLALEKKFIFLYDAQDLSVIVSNKLLKVFEELGSDFCLILLVPDNAQLLETVLSRAVKLKLTETDSIGSLEKQAGPDFSKLESPQELLAYLKSEFGDAQDLQEKKFIEYAIEKCLAQCTAESKNNPAAYKKLDELLKILKDYETRSAFNNSKLSRLSAFFS